MYRIVNALFPIPIKIGANKKSGARKKNAAAWRINFGL